MSSLDEELLSLVDQTPKGRSKPKQTPKSSKRKNISDSESSEDSDGEYGAKNRKTKKTPPKKKSKKQSSEEEEESEESEQSDDSSESGSMSSEEESDDGYDTDLMGDEEDRERLRKLTVLEREQILAERQSKRDERREKLEVQRKLREVSQREKRLSQSSQSSRMSRKKTPKEVRSTKLKELRERRANKKTEQKSKKSESEAESAEASSSDDEREKEREWEEKEREREREREKEKERQRRSIDDKQVQPEAKRELTVEDLNKVRVSRVHLANWVHLPWFKDTVKGCYVRVGIGASHGQHVYRVAEIVDVVDYHRAYELEKTLTKKALVLRQGSSKRTFRMEFCSNSLITKEEFSRWLEKETPNMEFIALKAQELSKRKAYNLTPEEVQVMLDEKKKLEGPRNPHLEKIDIEQRLKIAKTEENEEEIKRLQEELVALERFVEKTSSGPRVQKINVDDLNRRNQLEQVQSDFAYQQHRSKDKGERKENDPFARRPCQPLPFSIPSTLEDESKKKEEQKKEEPPEVEEPPKVEDPISISKSLDIDISFDLPSGTPPVPFGRSAVNKAPVNKVAASRASTLSQFKKEKGVF